MKHLAKIRPAKKPTNAKFFLSAIWHQFMRKKGEIKLKENNTNMYVYQLKKSAEQQREILEGRKSDRNVYEIKNCNKSLSQSKAFMKHNLGNIKIHTVAQKPNQATHTRTH